MKKIIITQSNYIPWKGYFDSINMTDEFIIYDDMQYTKRDWRNRNQIKTREGLKWLTIPVEVRGKYLQKINETKISDPGWGKNHWNSIVHNYSKSEFFRKYSEIFESIYLNNTEEFLSKVNLKFIEAVCEILGINSTFIWSSEFTLLEDRNERLIDICKQRGATDYYSGPAAKAYMDLSMFEKEKINVHWFDYSGYPEYRQQFGEFAHTVTILDLIFNEGPDTKKFMKSF
ncbi:MAG: WbqC family protein [Ignavibacteria bacterium]|nr:WbqC family protein [Ignavibacteria bacterium]